MSGDSYELYEETTYEVHDPFNARTIAVFYDYDMAVEYTQWLLTKAANADHPLGGYI